MNKSKKRRYCSLCRENFYNGNNEYGIKECWSLDDAKVVWRKEVGMNDVPPWDHKAKRTLDCFRRKGYVQVKPEISS